MGDLLTIADIVAECRLGVYDWEQRTPQTVWIDLELEIDARRASTTDRVDDAVDYGRLVTVVKEVAGAKPYGLMETLAEAIASTVLNAFPTPAVLVRITKKALPGIGYAAVEIRRRAPSARRSTHPRVKPRVVRTRP